MAKETIKEINGLPDYYVSNLGIVYSTKKSPRYNPKGEMRILRPRTHPSGYLYIGCFIGKGKTKKRLWRRVHRVVAQTFIGKIPKGMEINHLDGDKHNNNLSNLEVVSRQQNITHYHTILKPNKNVHN
jgi:hypothetical protein